MFTIAYFVMAIAWLVALTWWGFERDLMTDEDDLPFPIKWICVVSIALLWPVLIGAAIVFGIYLASKEEQEAEEEKES